VALVELHSVKSGYAKNQHDIGRLEMLSRIAESRRACAHRHAIPD
jgi:hypothetical protein